MKGLSHTYTCVHSPPQSPPIQAATSSESLILCGESVLFFKHLHLPYVVGAFCLWGKLGRIFYLTSEETEAHEGSSSLSKSTQQSWAGTGACAPGPVLFSVCPNLPLGQETGCEDTPFSKNPPLTALSRLVFNRGVFRWPRDPGQRHLHRQCLQRP